MGHLNSCECSTRALGALFCFGTELTINKSVLVSYICQPLGWYICYAQVWLPGRFFIQIIEKSYCSGTNCLLNPLTISITILLKPNECVQPQSFLAIVSLIEFGQESAMACLKSGL